MYIGRDYQKNILSYVDFTRLYNVISRFTKSNIDILKEGIIFHQSYDLIACKWRKGVLTNLNKYVKQIDTRTYFDYKSTENYYSQDCTFQRATEMKLACTIFFKDNIKRWEKYLFPCVKSQQTDIIWNYWGLL